MHNLPLKCFASCASNGIIPMHALRISCRVNPVRAQTMSICTSSPDVVTGKAPAWTSVGSDVARAAASWPQRAVIILMELHVDAQPYQIDHLPYSWCACSSELLENTPRPSNPSPVTYFHRSPMWCMSSCR